MENRLRKTVALYYWNGYDWACYRYTRSMHDLERWVRRFEEIGAEIKITIL